MVEIAKGTDLVAFGQFPIGRQMFPADSRTQDRNVNPPAHVVLSVAPSAFIWARIASSMTLKA